MPSNAFSSQLAALHWLINTVILCVEVRQRMHFLVAACLLSAYLVMLPPDTAGTHPKNRGRRQEEKMTHGTGGITEPYEHQGCCCSNAKKPWLLPASCVAKQRHT